MPDLITISDQASKSIREFLFPTLQENWRRTSRDPFLRMYDFDVEEQVSGTINKPRVNPAWTKRVGREIEIVHEHEQFGGGYGVAEDTPLTYGKRTEDRTKATIRFYEGGIKISNQDIAATRDDAFALVKEVGRHAKNALRMARKDAGRMIAYKQKAVLATVNVAVTNSTIVNVDNAGTSEADPVQFLIPTRKVWIGTTGEIEAGNADEHEIKTVVSRTRITLDTSGTFADDDSIVSKNAYESAAYREFETLDNLINNTGTVQNVDKANNYWFTSDITTVSGALSVTNIDTMARNTYEFAENPTLQFITGNKTQWGRYAALLTANRRTSGHREDFTGMFADGASGLSYFAPAGEQPFFLSNRVPDGYIYQVDPGSYGWAQMSDLKFLTDALNIDGTPGQRISGTTNYEFVYTLYGQQVQSNARSSGRLDAITS